MRLRDLADRCGMFIGAEGNQPILNDTTAPDNTNYTSTLSSQYSLTTAGNVLKMCHNHPSATTWDFAAGDQFVKWAGEHNVTVRAHNLVWPAHNPSWLSSTAASMTPAQLTDVMTTHVKTTASHYAGKVFSWDVVNEPLLDDPPAGCTHWTCALKTFSSSSSSSSVMSACGTVDWTRVPNYIALAFNTTRAYDDKAVLFVNEYNIHRIDNHKVPMLLQMVSDLRASGVPIGGVGMQMHIKDSSNPIYDKSFNATSFTLVLDALQQLGVVVHLTEADIAPGTPSVYGKDSTVAQKLESQAKVYGEMTAICATHPVCRSMEWWGFTDAHTDQGSPVPPPGIFPFDAEYQPKPAYAAIVSALESSC